MLLVYIYIGVMLTKDIFYYVLCTTILIADVWVDLVSWYKSQVKVGLKQIVPGYNQRLKKQRDLCFLIFDYNLTKYVDGYQESKQRSIQLHFRN